MQDVILAAAGAAADGTVVPVESRRPRTRAKPQHYLRPPLEPRARTITAPVRGQRCGHHHASKVQARFEGPGIDMRVRQP
jgi:hypothetical protein